MLTSFVCPGAFSSSMDIRTRNLRGSSMRLRRLTHQARAKQVMRSEPCDSAR